ncbi:MAG: chemotaxis protein CheA [Chitinivibrionia bacterium]|nr:chemotaxis protein CheA [Chitinivibrionia bacterium]
MGQENSTDLEMMIGFLDEAVDDLCNVVQNLMNLRSDGYDETTVQSLFRVFHSIKGNAAYFNLIEIKELSHAIEQVMEGMRQKKLQITENVIELLINGANGVSKAFEVIRAEGTSAKIPESVKEAKDAILNFLKNGEGAADNFQTLEEIIEDLTLIETNPAAVAEILQKYKEKLEKLKSAAEGKDAEAKESEDDKNMPPEYKELKKLMSEEKTYPSGDPIFGRIRVLMETLRQFIDEKSDSNKTIDEMLDNIAICDLTIGLDSLIKATILEQMAKLKIIVAAAPGQAKEEEHKKEEDAQHPQAAQAAVAKTMRISEESVDNFLAFVGELVIVEDMYMNLGSMAYQTKNVRKEDIVIELKKITETFSQLSRNLQKSIMEIRKVPIDQIFKRMPKIVNEVATKTDKKIQVKIEGGDLRIDKTILEILESPLVHMTRNAADHGIEKPEVRVAAGKDEEGTITLAATENAGLVIVTIKDDGGGLNLEKLRAKAIEIGIMSENESFDQEKIINVMFASGVSTATEVTDISGRGVGMDVVKKNLEKASGKIFTQTEHGKGTTFTLTIPSVMTTQIMQGFVVKTETDRFILPLECIEASVSVTEARIESVNESGHVFQFKEGVIPVARLAEAVEPTGTAFYADSKEIVVVVHNKGVYQAFIVSEVIGIHQIVKKDLMLPKEFTENISGSAIMGDGVVSLLLNIDALLGTEEN